MTTNLKQQVETALHPLTGLRMSAFGRAADLLWVHFGSLHRVPAWKRGWKYVGEFALHIQCPWRLRHGDTLVVGREDIFEERKGSKSVLFDSRAHSIPLRDAALVVSRVHADPVGGFVLEFRRHWALEIFPSASSRGDYESWRMFIPGGDCGHFVVSPSGADPSKPVWALRGSRR
jgi:hypothetical protein